MTDSKEKIQLRVAGGSYAKSVAGAIVQNMYEGKEVELLAVGAAANNQLVKACGIATSFAASAGHFLVYKVAFRDVKIEGADKSATVVIPVFYK